MPAHTHGVVLERVDDDNVSRCVCVCVCVCVHSVCLYSLESCDDVSETERTLLVVLTRTVWCWRGSMTTMSSSRFDALQCSFKSGRYQFSWFTARTSLQHCFLIVFQFSFDSPAIFIFIVDYAIFRLAVPRPFARSAARGCKQRVRYECFVVVVLRIINFESRERNMPTLIMSEFFVRILDTQTYNAQSSRVYLLRQPMKKCRARTKKNWQRLLELKIHPPLAF